MAIDLKTGQDLELLKLAETIAQQEDFSSVLLNASMDGVLAYDLNTCYTLWSPSMERISGFKSEDVMGKCAYDVFPFMKEVGLDELYRSTFRGEAARTGILPYVIPETGIEGFFEQQNFPIFNEKRKVIGGIAIVREVTDLKKTFDGLAQTNRALEERAKELEDILQRLRQSRSQNP